MTKLVDKPLTDLQRNFSQIYVNAFYGKEYLSNTEVAVKAGYAVDSAYQRAYELLNPRLSPHVVAYIGKLKEDFKIKNNIDPDKHMSRLNHLGRLAEEKGQYGVAGRMEELRGKVAGYYIDRQIINNKNDKSNMTEEEMTAQLNKILHDYKHVLEDTETGGDADDSKK